MRYSLFSLWRGASLPALLLSLLFFPSTALAVVGDVTLTGLPPNTTVSLTNEETKDKVEQKTDERGFVVIPMTGKSWQSGRHSVTCQVDGKPVTSRIFLRDGVNRVDLTALTLAARPLDPANRQKVNEGLKQSSATLKADPKNSQALLTQGSALNRLGRHGEALAQLARAVKMGSTHPALAFETGWSLMRLGLYPEAIAQLEKYEKMKPGLGQTSEFIGRSHLFMGELDKADAKFTEALKRDPKLASTTRFHQAILETLRKNPQAASNHIASLLKEAPNSPTAQIFRNATLQPQGAKPAAGAGAKDYKLSDPIKIQLPPTTAGDVAGAIAKGVVGGLLGGLFGGGGRQEPEGPNLVAKPSYPETMLASKDGKSKINLSGALVDGKPNIVMGVQESPGNGAPHLMLLQDKNCNVLQPADTSVTAIWEQWGAWRINVSWTKSYYQDGQLVKQEKGGWSTPWNEFKIQVKDPSEIPGIWKDFNSKPFEGIREALSTFDVPKGVPFNPADWNLITHATTDAGNNQLVTAPFVTGLGTDKDNNLIFKPVQQTACESAPPTAPLLASPTTFPWTVGPYGIDIAPDHKYDAFELAVSKNFMDDWGLVASDNWGRIFPRYRDIPTPEIREAGEKLLRGLVGDDISPRTETLPGAPATTETRPEGAKVEKRPDGTRVTTFPSGVRIVTRPDGSRIYTDTDGTVTETYRPPTTTPSEGAKVATLSSGIRVETRPDGTEVTTYPGGSVRETRSDGTAVSTERDGSVAYTRPDGTRISITPDGQKFESRPDGTVIHIYPSGAREERRADGTRVATIDGRTTEYHPDGTIINVHPDGGRTEIRAGGTTIVTDRDGKVVHTTERRTAGTQVTTYPDGTRVTTSPGGRRIETRPDGSETITHPDGTKTEIAIRPDGTRVTTFPGGFKLESRPDTHQTTTRPEGPIITTRSDGTTVMIFPDGRRIETRPDGTEVTIEPKGPTIETRPEGAKVEKRPDGITIETRPDGTRIQTHPSGVRHETGPDGTTVTFGRDGTLTATTTTRPDGTEIITYPDGMKIERHPDGSSVTTYPDGRTANSSYISDGRTRIVIWSDGRRVEHHRDGPEITTLPDGTRTVRRYNTLTTTYPDGTQRTIQYDEDIRSWVEIRPDGTRVENRNGVNILHGRDGSRTAVFPDGSRVEVGKDGSINLRDPAPTAPQPADTPAPPTVLDFLDEAIVPS